MILNNCLVLFADEKQSGSYIAKWQTCVLAVTVLLYVISAAGIILLKLIFTTRHRKQYGVRRLT